MTTRTTDRNAPLTHARRLAAFTGAWNVADGVIAITAALVAKSRALIGIGLDSAVESISATVLLCFVLPKAGPGLRIM